MGAAAALLAVVLALALAPAAAQGDASSLYRGPGQRPGPDMLYQPPATAPELTNAGIWHAPPILISGASAYRSGEFVYQDWLYDDHGAHGAYRDQHDPQVAPGGVSTSGDLFSIPNGTYTYPTDPAYAGNAADLVELRLRPLADATAFRVGLNSLKDPALIGVSIALGGTPGVAVPFPYGANAKAPADLFVTIHGTSADLRNPAGGVLDGSLPVTVDMQRRQLEVRVPHSDWNPTGKVRLAAGVGLWDRQANRYLLPHDDADATHPGGAGGLGATAPAFFNLAFRFEHSTDPGSGKAAANEEPRPVPADLNGVLANQSWWRDRAQGQALAMPGADISAFYVNVDFAKLNAGGDDDMANGSQGVPYTGAMDRILSSHFETAQGRDYSSACASADGCKGELRGQLQPYAIYIPNKPAPPSGYGLTLLLHSLSANYNQYLATKNQSEIGDRGAGSIVITPEGRGPDGWYYDYAGADTFEVWADVAARYHLDPSYGAISGYSMGGYGTYKFATQYPDLFAKGQPVVGPPALGVWVPPNAPTGGDRSNSNRQLESLRNIPFLIWNASSDELVPLPGPVAQANRFDALGYRYEFDVFSPAEHLTLAFNDEYKPAADFLGADKVNLNPPHVSYVYNPTMDFPGVGTAAGHAYWISQVKLRSASQPQAGAGLGSVDARSQAFGVGDPPASPTERGGGALTGGTVPAISYSSQARSWGAQPTAPARDQLDLRATNVSELTIDAARARLSCHASLNVTSDGPLTTNLVDCPGGKRGGLVGFPGQCGSRRNFAIHVGRALKGRITSITVFVGHHRSSHIRGHDLGGARVDLRGLPRGRFTVKVVLRVVRAGHARTVVLRRRYRTCQRKHRHHRRHGGKRGAGQRRR